METQIVPRLVGPVLTVTIWAALVCYLALIKGQNVFLTNSVLPLLSVVVSPMVQGVSPHDNSLRDRLVLFLYFEMGMWFLLLSFKT
jgi:hypothetical protein